LPPALVWFRQDLRLEDNPALAAALDRGGPVVPLFIWAPEEEGAWPPGAASRWWLHHSLAALQQHSEQVGSRLVIRIGPSLDTLRHGLAASGGSAVYWNHRYEPVVWERDAQIKQSLREAGIEAESFNAALLYEPGTVQNKAGRPFQVFTPFWRHCLNLPAPPVPLPAPERLTAPVRWPAGASLEQLRLLPHPDWAGGLRQTWQPGPSGARTRLEQFLKEGFQATLTVETVRICQPHPGSLRICISGRFHLAKSGMPCAKRQSRGGQRQERGWRGETPSLWPSWAGASSHII
jgi:deoxyribodipyrimidine photo-lyase